MFDIRTWFHDLLGGALNPISWIILVVGILMTIVGIANITGEKKNFRNFLMAFILGTGLIVFFLWLKKPFGIFEPTTFSR